MKKVLSFLVVAACVVMLGSSAFAAVSKTVSSVANFTSKGEISLSFDLKNIADDTDATAINWDIENIPLNVASTNWTTATTYAVLSATITTVGGKVYMYQDNTNGTTYISTAARTSGNNVVYSGMVNKATKGGDYRGYVPMVFQSTGTKATPNFGTNPESAGNTRYFIDKADSNFSTQTNYITIAAIGGLTGGVDADKNPFFIGSNTGYMYFGGLFQNILGGDEFGTDKIQIVSTIE